MSSNCAEAELELKPLLLLIAQIYMGSSFSDGGE
jgi:hypothetical protein